MRRTRHESSALLIWVGVAAVLTGIQPALAQPATPPLTATITYETPPPVGGFGPTDPIKVVLQIENTSGAPVLSVGRFSSSDFFRRLYFTDPLGGTVTNKSEEQLHSEGQALQCLARKGVLQSPAIPILPVDVLPGPAGEPQTPHFFREYRFDARTFYDLTRPGRYTVEARIPLLVFSASDPSAVITDCDLFAGIFANLAAETGRQGFTIRSNTLEFTVAGPPPSPDLTALGSALLWISLQKGIKVDLVATVRRNGVQVGTGQIASVSDETGKGNTGLLTVPLTLTSGRVGLASGDLVTFDVSIRNACVGSGKNSGQATLSFNDDALDSSFDATLGGVQSFHLRDGGTLSTTPATGPKKSVRQDIGPRCSPFRSFGSWSLQLP